MKNQTSEKYLKTLLEIANVPEALIQTIEARSPHYRKTFNDTMRAILQNEVLNFLAFMEIKEDLKEKGGISNKC